MPTLKDVQVGSATKGVFPVSLHFEDARPVSTEPLLRQPNGEFTYYGDVVLGAKFGLGMTHLRTHLIKHLVVLMRSGEVDHGA